jgi:hypothetical protein
MLILSSPIKSVSCDLGKTITEIPIQIQIIFIDIKSSKWIIIKNNTKYTIQTYKASQLRRQAGVISHRT